MNMKRIPFICVFTIIVFSAISLSAGSRFISAAGIGAKISHVVDQPSLENARWGIAVYDLNERKMVYSRNLERSFMPASNMKLFTTAVALEKLGADYRYPTRFYVKGFVKDHVLYGDLVVRGSGDPSLAFRYSDDKEGFSLMQGIAREIHEAGIHKIKGRIVGDDNYFSEELFDATWEVSDLPYWYAAESDGLNYNENVVHFSLAGKKPLPELMAKSDLNYMTFVNHLRSRRERRTLFDYSRDLNNVVTVFGNVRPGSKRADRVSVHNPTLFFLTALHKALESEKVDVSLSSVVDIDDLSGEKSELDYENLKMIYCYYSPELSELVTTVNKISHNLYADCMLRTLGKECGSEGSFAAGGKVVADTLLEWGIDPYGFAMRDGSGLSRRNLVTPQAVIGLLLHMQESKNAELYFNSLPISHVDGTLERRFANTSCKDKIHAKTGYINKVRALSGYAEGLNGKRYAFSIICNNYLTSTAFINGLQDKLCDLIVRLEK